MGEMKVVAVINMKGGVAKTTTVRNMAYVMWHRFGKKVLVVDSDESGSLSDGFECRPEITPGVPYDGIAKLMVEDDCTARDVIVHTAYEGIDIIPANGTVGAAKKVLLGQSGKISSHYIFQKKIAELQNDYDYCLVDCTPDSNLLEENILLASHEVIIPSEIDTDSIDRAATTKLSLDEVRSYATTTPVYLRGILFTKVEYSSMDRQGLLQEYPDSFPVFDTFIRKSVIAKQSRNQCICCSEFSPKATISIDYDNFVAEFLREPLPHAKGASRKKLREEELEKQQAQSKD